MSTSRHNGSDWSPWCAARVDEACDRFEEAWRNGRPPRIEDYLANAPDDEKAMLFRELLELELELWDSCAGHLSPTPYCNRFPDFTEIVEDVFHHRRRDSTCDYKQYGAAPRCPAGIAENGKGQDCRQGEGIERTAVVRCHHERLLGRQCIQAPAAHAKQHSHADPVGRVE